MPRGSVIAAAPLAVLVLLASGSDPARAGERRVVDAGGRQLGALVGLTDGLAQVVVETAGPPVALTVGRDGVVGGLFGATYFENDDCQGPPRLLDLPGLLPGAIPPIGITSGVTPEGRLVVPTGAPAATTIESTWSPGSFPECDSSPAGAVQTFAATEVLDLAAFTAPFSLDGGGSSALASRPVSRRPVAVDGAGELLGPLIGGGALVVPGGGLPLFTAVLFETPGGPAPVTLAGDQAVFGTTFVGYAANNCTGPPLVVDLAAAALGGTVPFFPPLGVAADGTLLVGGASQPPVVINSFWFPVLSMTGCVTPMAPAVPVLQATVLEDLSVRPQPFGVALRETGPTGAGRGTGDLTVVDSAGVALGPVVSVGGFLDGPTNVVALIQAGRRHGEVTVRKSGLARGTLPAQYTLAGCTGPPLVQAAPPGDPEPLYPPTALGPGNVLYSADGALEIANIQFRWNPVTATCDPDSTGPSFIRRTTVLKDLSHLVPPFTAP